jgi:hypothetical protein
MYSYFILMREVVAAGGWGSERQAQRKAINNETVTAFNTSCYSCCCSSMAGAVFAMSISSKPMSLGIKKSAQERSTCVNKDKKHCKEKIETATGMECGKPSARQARQARQAKNIKYPIKTMQAIIIPKSFAKAAAILLTSIPI